MSVKKVLARLCIILGAAMLLGAVGLLVYNQVESYQAQQASEAVLPSIQAAIAQASEETQQKTEAVMQQGGTDAGSLTDAASDAATDTGTAFDPTSLTIGDYDYIGILQIPAIGIELPVMSDWDKRRLKIAPCRYYGAAETNDLVIAAHNYASHFGKLRRLTAGELVLFTDMDGIQYVYEVVCIDTLRPNDVKTMLESEYDLSLYTCTSDGTMRVTVRCNLAADYN